MGGVGSGPRKQVKGQLRDAIDNINVEEIIGSLREWAKGKEIVCPHCNRPTGAYTADTVALQSAIELLNRRLGKVPQSVQVDVTEHVQLSADQIDTLLFNRFGITIDDVRSYIEGKRLLTEGVIDV